MRNVVIVEDDPMVALINKKYVEMIEDFQVVGTVSNKEDLIKLLEKNDVALILMDIYLPKENGIQILKHIRERGIITEVIMMTAADNTEEIKTAFAYGVIDYLIKPFEFDRFKKAIEKYNKKRSLLIGTSKLDQTAVDKLYSDDNISNNEYRDLPKGINKTTLNKIYEVIENNKKEYWTIRQISKETGVSNVTIKKYIDYLESIDKAIVTIDYGNIGRPEYKYTFK
ncbi:response regulator [Clostridium sardiniense]|uniref:Transcriptional regulatory protein n=1 Tax=Clostridium sardiniense TaxID=29369 RepID=A0ABS7L087_CLOSR|nr:response regulator [Clostridium sardiniense]MBY0756262.1 response regulator [Clostridium sardiniense]MDQ0458794.1 two-component system CitB family response regulator/CitB family two-component system response regulator MalR [Clostridium sardiniense]